MANFSCSTEQAERAMFAVLNAARKELSEEERKSGEVSRVLATMLKKNPFDLRGSRRLHSVLEQYKVSYFVSSIQCIL